MPLFLELVRQVSARDPGLARRALAGLEAYENAPRPAGRDERPVVARVRGAALRDHGGQGPPLVLIPSLINPPDILDLDEETSLTIALARGGRRVMLVDWGEAAKRAQLSIAGHLEQLLLPLLRSMNETPALIGYCLGGTMAIAAGNLAEVEKVVTLAAPWHFSRYSVEARGSLARLWEQSVSTAEKLGALPMEVMQAGFWALDPERTVRKFALFGEFPPGSDEARRFVTLEDWANEGEPLPFPAARELFEFYRDDAPGAGKWMVGGEAADLRIATPALHVVAGDDRIVPPASAPEGHQYIIRSGHVGMIVGRAREELHRTLAAFLAD